MTKKSKKPVPKTSKSPERSARVAPQSKAPAIDFYWIALGVVILCTSLLRLHLLNIPLERDEGEYAYIAKLMMKGIPLFSEAYTMKLPGTSMMYAILMTVFGDSNTGIHTGLLILGIGTIIFLFLAFRKLFNAPIALFAASVFAIMSVSPTVLGFAAHATHFIAFFVALALFFLARFYERRNLLTAFLIGLMLGLAFMMKQQAVFFIVFGGIAIILGGVFEKPVKWVPIILQTLMYSVAAVLPYVIMVFYLKGVGTFDKFWFWTITYAGKYAGGLSLAEGAKEFVSRFTPMLKEFTLFWILFFAGIVLTFLVKLTLKQKLLILLFTLFAFLTVCPGFYFRRHYFIVFLPAIGLLGGVALYYFTSLLNRYSKSTSISVLPFIVFCIAGISAVSGNKDYYFNFTPAQIAKQQYGNNPFNESLEIADYIKKNSSDTAKIAVLGSEPQIAFYADRLSATGYIYTYPLVEIQPYNQQMQEEMAREIEKNNPELIVYCLISASWLGKEGSPDTIFTWFNSYSAINYTLVGVVDIYNERTIYKWDQETVGYKAASQQQIMVYKRKV
ncbi:MAG TPA: glycosyltransferase family 39 protein [Saprospiraceae bacterium]|nr:glycosyltransferase family 39 protein [Saprospiraceae bacterium]